MNFRGKKILVTGASGFLGARLVEYLVLAHQGDVRALVRDLGRSVRLSRLPVELAFGDVRDERAVQSAVEGCSIVVHCASRVDAGSNPLASSTFLGTKIIAQSALGRNVERLVHVSSCAVYGSPGNVEVDESYPLTPRWKGDVYGNAKISAEALVGELSERGLPAVIIQPTMIYGPYSREWSVHPLRILHEADYALPAGGICNPVYVDDVVRAIILAAAAKTAKGERYLISGPNVVEWTTFYKSLEAKGTNGRVISLTDDAFSKRLAAEQGNKTTLARLRRLAGQPEIRALVRELPLASRSYQIAKRLLSRARKMQLKAKHVARANSADFENVARAQQRLAAVAARLSREARPVFLPQFGLLEIYRARSRYSIRKASLELGYRPQIDLEQGMQLTADWARWSRLL
jgi:nucleoside-diphosphate-sugar epimerase